MTSSSSQPAARRPASGPTRRTVVAAVGAVGAAGFAAALTACGSDDGSSSVSSDADSTNPGSSPGGSGEGGDVLARTADIPEGGGKIFKEQGVVVTQPTAGTFRAFSAKCTHQGCAVSGVTDGVITCPCHQSAFSVSDGSVRKGPATKPLPAQQITVEGDSITLA